MYIVLELNQDEFGRGNSRPVHKFEQDEAVINFCASYRGDASRLEIFEAKPIAIEINLVHKA